MPTKVEILYPNGEVDLLEIVTKGRTLHAFAEVHKNYVGRSILVRCTDDDVRADIYEPRRPETITSPMDASILEALCSAENHSTYVLRNDTKTFDMNDFEEGPFTLVVSQLVEYGKPSEPEAA